MSISLKKLAPLKSVEPIVVTYCDEDISIKQYLPINKKAEIIEKALNNIFNDKGIISPVRRSIFYVISIIMGYTNINITDKMLEKADELYDTFIINGIFDYICHQIPEKELKEFEYLFNESLREVKEYNTSFAGMMEQVNQDYSNTKVNVDEIVSDLSDPDKIGFVKEVLDKIG